MKKNKINKKSAIFQEFQQIQTEKQKMDSKNLMKIQRKLNKINTQIEDYNSNSQRQHHHNHFNLEHFANIYKSESQQIKLKLKAPESMKITSIKKNQKRNNLKLLWEKTQKNVLKKQQLIQKLQNYEQSVKNDFNFSSFSPAKLNKNVSKINISLRNQENLSKKLKRLQILEQNNPKIYSSPYTTFGNVLIPKNQLKVSRWSVKRNKLFQDPQIFNPERQIIIRNALEKMRLKYSTLSQVQFEQMVLINTIKQSEHPGPAIKKQRKQVLMSISQSIKKNSKVDTQRISKASSHVTTIRLQDLRTNCELESDKIYKKKIISFLEFVIKVNYSNQIYKEIRLFDKYPNYKKHKVYVGPGNNKFLIVGLLKRRFWLQIVDKISNQIQFFWTQGSLKQIHNKQLSSSMFYASQKQKISYKSQQLNNKSKVIQQFSSLKRSQSIQNTFQEESPKKYRQIQFRLKTRSSKKQKLNLQIQDCNKKLFINQKKNYSVENYSLKKIAKIMSQCSDIKGQQIKNLNFQQTKFFVTNHIPSNSYIGSKKALFYTMQYYYRYIKKIDPFQVIPKTYHVSNLENFNNFIASQKNNSNSIWIVKPGECTNRGNGIFLIKHSQISNNLLKQEYHKSGQQKTMIFQSYITNPMLYHGRKFDIRHYMMITTINGSLKAYWYEEGYIRTCSEIFSLTNLKNVYIHLNNDAVQKYSENYGKYQPGNKLSYSQFQRYLENQFDSSSNKKTHKKTKINFKQIILSRMKQIALDVIKANYLNLDKDRKMNNFQIFGLDFMVDSKLNVWLIQINSNPCLELSCPLLSRIIPTMIEHSLRLSLDPLILPQTHYPPSKRYYVADNILKNLKYQIIFDQLQEKLSNKNQIQQLVRYSQKNKDLILGLSQESEGQFYQNDGKQMQLKEEDQNQDEEKSLICFNQLTKEF